jgi:acetyl esterase/lipase
MPVPDALLLFSPWLDLARDSESNRLNLEALSPFDRSDMETYGALYAGAVPFEDPRVSPLRGSVAGFPPVFIESSEVEYLRPDAQAFVAVLKQAGVAVEERTEAFALHGWQLFPDLLPEAQRSVQAVGEFLRRLQPAAASRATVRRGNASARSSSVKVSGGAKRTA